MGKALGMRNTTKNTLWGPLYMPKGAAQSVALRARRGNERSEGPKGAQLLALDAPRSGAPHKLPPNAVKTALDFVLAACANTQRKAGNSDTFQQLAQDKVQCLCHLAFYADDGAGPGSQGGNRAQSAPVRRPQGLARGHGHRVAGHGLDTGVRRRIPGLVRLPALPDYPNFVLPSPKTPSNIKSLTARVMNTAFMDGKKLIVQGHAEMCLQVSTGSTHCIIAWPTECGF